MPKCSDVGDVVFEAVVSGTWPPTITVVLWGALPFVGQDRAVQVAVTIPELSSEAVSAAVHRMVGDFEDWRRVVGCTLPVDWRVRLADAVFSAVRSHGLRIATGSSSSA